MTRANAAKLSAVFPEASADLVIAAAQVAQDFGLDQLWVGDPYGGEADVADDRYVITTIAAASARTRELRFGAFMRKLAEPDRFTAAETLHSAEDLSVIDQASGGRLEVAFVPTAEGWVERLELVLGLWTDGWEVGDGRTVAVTPPPAQPVLPRLIVSEDVAAATRLGAGRVVEVGAAPEAGVRARTVMLKQLDESVREWLEEDPLGVLDSLREELAQAGAGQVLFALGPGQAEDDLRALGTVVGPCVRCARHDVERLVGDAWNWFREGSAAAAEPDYFKSSSAEFAARP